MACPKERNDLHIYCEAAAIGDAALNLCRCNAAMLQGGQEKAVIHTSSVVRFTTNAGNIIELPASPDVMTIWNSCNFVREVMLDVVFDETGPVIKDSQYEMESPMIYRPDNCPYDIRDWIDLKKFTPTDVPTDRPITLFQPISLKHVLLDIKSKKNLDDYIPVWDRCLQTLINKNHHIIMVGGKDDPIDWCVNKKFMSKIDNRVGQWSYLQAIACTLYQANEIVSCDSWAGIWGAACRKKTAIAFGYGMEHKDYWVLGFLGNTDCYKYGYSSQKDYCDALLAAYLGEK